MDIKALAVAGDHLAKQDGAAIAQLWVVAAKLVTGVHRGQRLGALRYRIAGNGGGALRRGQPIRVDAQVVSQLTIHADRPGLGHRGGRQPAVEMFRQACVAVVERNRGSIHRVTGCLSLLELRGGGGLGSERAAY